MKIKFKLEDRAFKKTLKEYSKISSLNLGEIIRRRSVRVAIALTKAYRALAPTKSEIDNKVSALGGRIKTRKSVRKGKRTTQVKREISARKRSITYTAMGWLHAGKKAGIGLKSNILAKFKGKTHGEGKAKLTGKKPYVILENTQPGATAIESKHAVINTVLKAEAKDMKTYIERKTLKKKTRKFK